VSVGFFEIAKKHRAWTSLRGGKPHKEVHALCYTQSCKRLRSVAALWVQRRLNIALCRQGMIRANARKKLRLPSAPAPNAP
jgi:hypothetical protein